MGSEGLVAGLAVHIDKINFKNKNPTLHSP